MTKRILIVEDDPGTQEILRRMIGRIDYTANVNCVDSAEAAYQTLSSASGDGQPFDLVLADLDLPNADGLMLKEAFQIRHPEVDFLVISGVSFKEWNKRAALHRDTPMFLQKPVTEKQLRMFWEQCFLTVGALTG